MPSIHEPLLMLLLAFQPNAAALTQPPRSAPFDCSWIYDPPLGNLERFEGVFTSFIDNSGFYACSGSNVCGDWMGKQSVEIAFSSRAMAQRLERRPEMYGVYKITFEGRRGKLRDRDGCERHPWGLDQSNSDYVQVENILRLKPL